MKRLFILTTLLVFFQTGSAQELYVFSDPASNNPARSVSVKNTAMLQRVMHENRLTQRQMPEVMLGLSKNLMVRAGGTFSDMHQPRFKWESARLYAKYRFLSSDEVHRHFRMAAFAGGTYSRNHLDHNEISLTMGDQSGVQAGLIATQLWNKLAVSATGAWNEVLDEKRREKLYEDTYAFRAITYSLSAGYLLFPRKYENYEQTNLNLYLELLGGRNIGFAPEKFYLDLAPSIQLIFNSTSKLNLGYRFELSSDIYRIATRGYLLSYEYLFLNALKKRKH